MSDSTLNSEKITVINEIMKRQNEACYTLISILINNIECAILLFVEISTLPQMRINC